MNLTNENESIGRRKAKGRDGLYKRRDYWHYELIIDGKKRSFTTGTKAYNEAKKKRAHSVAELEQGKARPRIRTASVSSLLLSSTLSIGRQPSHLGLCASNKNASGLFGGAWVIGCAGKLHREYQAARARQVSPRTANVEIKLLRGILKAEGEWKRLADDVKPLKAKGEITGRALTADQGLGLFDMAESKPEWMVAHLTAVIANDTGMRGIEVRNLRLGEIDIDARIVTIGKSKNDSGLRRVELTKPSKLF